MTIRGPDILMNAMVIFVTLFTQNRSGGRGTPNLRIVLAVALVAFATTSCDKLGLGTGGNPTGPDPTPPPSARLDHHLRGDRGERCAGDRLQRALPAVRRLPRRDGLRPGGLAPASHAGIFRHRVQPGTADLGHRPRLRVARPSVRPADLRQLHRSGTAADPPEHHPRHHLRRWQRGQHHHCRAGRRRGRQQSGRLHRSAGGGVRRRLRHAAAGHPQPRGSAPASSS